MRLLALCPAIGIIHTTQFSDSSLQKSLILAQRKRTNDCAALGAAAHTDSYIGVLLKVTILLCRIAAHFYNRYLTLLFLVTDTSKILLMTEIRIKSCISDF